MMKVLKEAAERASKSVYIPKNLDISEILKRIKRNSEKKDFHTNE